MAESKSILLAKSASKYAGRAKEKLLQNLGKVDRTADEIFDEHLNNFQRQQNSASRLQKEFNNYIRCIRAVQVASKSLMEAINEVYETQWSGSEPLYAQASTIDVLWQDFSHKLGDQVLIPLNTYTAQFPEMRKKIDKRGRKLVDYDSQRHSFQNLQANAAKRKDDVKITKGRDQLDEAKRTYEILNTELHDELPALHDSRILFLVTNLQTLFASEQMFHQETAKIYAELEAIVDKLATESQRGSYTLKNMKAIKYDDFDPLAHSIAVNSNPSSVPSSPIKMVNNISNSYPPLTNGSSTNGIANGASPSSPTSSADSPTPYEQQLGDQQYQNQQQRESFNGHNEPSYMNTTAMNNNNHSAEDLKTENEIAQPPKVAATTAESINNNVESTNKTESSAINSSTNEKLNNNHIKPSNDKLNSNNNNNMEELYDIPVGATTTDLPPGVLYRVKATYKYVREDVDELSFDVGDTIQVIEYDDPEDQEEGWLMGTKEGSDEKGMFPANFTRPM